MVCIVALCITIWGVFVMFRNRVYALVTMLIFAAVEQFIYSHIDIHSVWNGLHYINIINIININATFSSYRNWGVGTYVFPVFSAKNGTFFKSMPIERAKELITALLH